MVAGKALLELLGSCGDLGRGVWKQGSPHAESVKKQHTGSMVNILQVRISSFGHPAPICGSPEQQRKQRELL